MKALALACLLAAAGLWSWALLAPTEEHVLPADLAGRYKLFRYEPGTGGSKTNPFPPDQIRIYTLREDATYLIQILVAGDSEMSRSEGLLLFPESGRVEFRQISSNRVLDRASDSADATTRDQHYGYAIRRLQEGPVLVLTHAKQGYELYLRPEPN